MELAAVKVVTPLIPVSKTKLLLNLPVVACDQLPVPLNTNVVVPNPIEPAVVL